MLSAVVLTKNEEENIIDCLESLSFCDEIIVVDDNSEDRTVDLAKRNGAKVFVHSLDGDFSLSRNFGLGKARGEWVLFIDADERISSPLKREISYVILSNGRGSKTKGYFLKRKDVMWGRSLTHGETGNIRLLRLARRDVGKWEGKVHEVWKIKGKIQELSHPIIHYPHQNIALFLQKINFYSDLRAHELFAMGKKASFLSIILYPKGKFFVNYFVKLGFLDGTFGLVHAMLMSLHSFLVRGKLWLLWNIKQK